MSSTPTEPVDLLVIHASTLITLDTGPPGPLRGAHCEDLASITDGAVAIRSDRILSVGPTEEILSRFESPQILDATGRMVLPGFIDSHTHPVFASTREDEFAMRLAGADYSEIARSGGGIRSSVRSLRATSDEELLTLLLTRLDQFLLLGTTTVEAKSGYGLSLADEIRSLEIIAKANRIHPVDLVPTFLGAHEVPDEYRDHRDRYIDLVIQEMIPKVAENSLARFCDVFCEEDVFNLSETERILLAAREAGLRLKIHAEELGPTGGAGLAAQMGATSADHLVKISPEDIEAMAEAGVVAVLLPGTTFHLGKKDYAPARAFFDAGVPIAVATDFNPGTSMTQSIPMILTLSCLQLGLPPSAALVGVTRNAAAALDLEPEIGRLAPGWSADLLIVNASGPNYLPYHYAANCVDTVVKNGRVVVREGRRCA